jgi:hypothetical protein
MYSNHIVQLEQDFICFRLNWLSPNLIEQLICLHSSHTLTGNYHLLITICHKVNFCKYDLKYARVDAFFH